MTYLLNTRNRHRDGNDLVYPAPEIVARWNEANRSTGRNLGMFNIVEGTGKPDKSGLSIRTIMPEGRGAQSTWTRTTSDDVRQVVRTMRDDDEQALAVVDERIADLTAQLAEAQHERRTLLHAAFRRGDRVLPQELIRQANALWEMRGQR